MVPRMTKYGPLQDHLEATDPGPLAMTFGAIAGLVGGLPASASKYRAWWANDRTHVQALAWLDAGREVASVDLAVRRVRFTARGG